MKQIFILRGLPSGGKSTLSKILVEGLKHSSNGVKILSADDLRIVDGEYQFIPELEPYIWQEFENKFQDALNEEIENIIIDNTNLKEIHYKNYKEDALEKGYRVHEIIVGDFNVDNAVARNQHGVPKEAIEKMKQAFEFPK